jgi:hypothetical protein
MADASLQYRRGFEAIHAVLIDEWDPIGVGDIPEAQDEYDSYIPAIYRLLTEESDFATIASHLDRIQIHAMGLYTGGEKTLEIAKRLREVFDAVSHE